MADKDKGSLASGVAASRLKALGEKTEVDVPAVLAKRPSVAASRDAMKRITMIVEGDFHHRLKRHALEQRTSLENIYREALEDYVQKHGIE
jgi:hypothetical protein